MGYNTTVIVLNDALDQIAKDPEFGKKLAAAITRVSGPRSEPVDVSAGNHCNAATVIETHHADNSALVLIGGNYGSVIGQTYGWKHHEKDDQLAMLKRVLDGMGYTVAKKPGVRKS